MLALPMRKRGIDWRTTDIQPADIGLPPEQMPCQCDALAALSRFGSEVDVVFWAWWIGHGEGDAELADECTRRQLPALFVGEPRGGRTGSVALWERAQVQPLSALLAGVDVPCWPDMQDRTWIVEQALL